MNDLALPNGPAGARCGFSGELGGREFFFRKTARNPLIRLVSDENPRKSKLFQPPKSRGFRKQVARSQENPRRSYERIEDTINITIECIGSPASGGRPCRAPLAAAAAPGVVLRVADRVVRVGLDIAAGEDLGGGRRPGVDVLIGAAAGEREGPGGDDDAERYARPVGRSLLGRRAGEGEPSGRPVCGARSGQPVGVFRRTSPHKIGLRPADRQGASRHRARIGKQRCDADGEWSRPVLAARQMPASHDRPALWPCEARRHALCVANRVSAGRLGLAARYASD